MAKSKKKKHQKQKPIMLKKPRYHCPTDNYDSLINLKIAYRETDFATDKIPPSTLYKEIAAYHFTKNIDEQRASQLLIGNENNACKYFEEVIQSYMSEHKDLDQNLNIYNPNKNLQTADILNFKEYEAEYKSPGSHTDLLTQIYDIVNENPDPSLLWPTNEYTIINYSDTISFVIHRTGYDMETKRVKCEIACYQKFILFVEKVIEVPVYQCQVELGINSIQKIDNDLSNNQQESAECDKLVLQMLKMKNISHDTPQEYVPVYRLNALTSAIDLSKYGNKYMQHKLTKLSINELHVATNIFSKIATDPFVDYDEKTDQSHMNVTNFMRQKINIPIACIILTNHMLNTKKLSKPVTTATSKITYMMADSDSENQTVRKTRHLGKIQITSTRKPTAPSVEKIIKYTMSQWGRRGYIRHYKSGKTVEIKPTTVHRKCVTLDNNVVTKTKNSTEYVVHSDKIPDKKG